MKTRNGWKEIGVFLAAVLAALWGGKVSVAQVQVPQKPSCLEQAAAQIRPNGGITVVLRDKSKVRGRLVSVDLSQSHLTMTSLDPTDTALSVYSMSDISIVQYSGGGRAGRMMRGFLIGSAVGVLFGLAGDNSGGTSDQFKLPDSAVFGALGGLFGLTIGLAMSSTRTIECK
ncbi:MAG: hypothetical protein L0196_08365 [candidate division Zixibacteria bacterium]|nr:hypothetical protein [candidate division Zixibacteria bacterium]